MNHNPSASSQKPSEKRDASIAGLQNNCTWSPNGEESKKIIHEKQTKTQCSYWFNILDRRRPPLHVWDLFDSHRIHKTIDQREI